MMRRRGMRRRRRGRRRRTRIRNGIRFRGR